MKSTFEPKERRVCSVCVPEPFLSGEIEKCGASASCAYCEQERSTFSVGQIADSIRLILADFYWRRYDEDGTATPEGQRVNKVISELTQTTDGTFAEDVRSVLADGDPKNAASPFADDRIFDPGVRYYTDNHVDASDFENDWRAFERSLKTETRYFNRHAEHVLATIFEGIDEYSTRSRRPVIAEAGQGTGIERLYRARVFETELELREAMRRPDLEVGPPPTAKAVAGRMNAAGVAVFYGATDPDVALAEVRPPVGCKVLIGCFEVIRPLRLLDLTTLNEIRNDNRSLFDEAYRHSLKRAQFLRGLSWRLSKPVMPNDQPAAYLPTQAITDFLATAECPPLPLDGIVYPSVQAGYPDPSEPNNRFMFGHYRKQNFNVVLFHKAARVQRLEEGTDISVSDDSVFPHGDYINDDPYLRYTVQVACPEPVSQAGSAWDDSTLKFSSLEVRYVRSVRFDTVSSTIHRFYGEKPELDK